MPAQEKKKLTNPSNGKPALFTQECRDTPSDSKSKSWFEYFLKYFAFSMGVLAAISLGVVACVAFYTVLGWGGWPLAIITGFAAFFTELVVYLQGTSNFKKFYHEGIDNDLKKHCLDLLQNKDILKEEHKEKLNLYCKFKFSDFSPRLKVENEEADCLLPFRRKRIALYIAMLFALGSGLCFGVVGFTHWTTAFSFLLGFAAVATPSWVIAIASVTAFAAVFTYALLMADAINKVFSGGFSEFMGSMKSAFIPKEFSIYEVTRLVLNFLLLVSLVVAVVLAGLASGGMLMEAATKVFIAIAQFSAPLVNSIATIVTSIFWVPLMVLFLLYNSWLTIKNIFGALWKLTTKKGRDDAKEYFQNKIKGVKPSVIPFYVLGCLVVLFFFSMHVISEGALNGEGAKGGADFFSNVFLRFCEFITTLFKLTFLIPAVTIAVVISTLVEILEDFPYFAGGEEDEHAGCGHDHNHLFLINAFGETGSKIIIFFSDHGLLKLLGLAFLVMMGELLIGASAAWISQTAFWGISTAMAPSLFVLSLLAVTLMIAVAIYCYRQEESAGNNQGVTPCCHDHGSSVDAGSLLLRNHEGSEKRYLNSAPSNPKNIAVAIYCYRQEESAGNNQGVTPCCHAHG